MKKTTTSLIIAFVLFANCSASAQWRSVLRYGLINCLTADGSNIYAGFGSIVLQSDTASNGILVSSDYGLTWSDVDRGQIGSSVYTLATEGSVMYAGSGYVFYDIGDTNTPTVWRSLDRGLTWQQMQLKQGYQKLTSIAVHETHIFAATTRGLLRSDDSGVSWKVLVDSAYYGPIVFMGSKMYIGSAWRGLLVSADTGLTWNIVGLPFGTSLNGIVVSGSTIIALLDAPDWNDLQNDTGQFVAFSSDSGRSWLESFIGSPVDESFDAIAVSGKSIYGASGTSIGTSWFSSNEGKTWASLTNSADGSGGPNLFSSLIVAGNNLVAGSQTDGISYYPLSSLSVAAPDVKAACVSISPNPTPGLVTIRGAAGAVSLEDALGREVKKNALPATNEEGITLDLRNEPAGVYFVRIQTATGPVLEKIIRE